MFSFHLLGYGHVMFIIDSDDLFSNSIRECSTWTGNRVINEDMNIVIKYWSFNLLIIALFLFYIIRITNVLMPDIQE